MSNLRPRPAGAKPPARSVSPRDRALVEWVAAAAVGDRIPEPWRWARSPNESVILSLVSLGVIASPAPGTDQAELVADAAAAARVWLEANPPASAG